MKLADTHTHTHTQREHHLVHTYDIAPTTALTDMRHYDMIMTHCPNY